MTKQVSTALFLVVAIVASVVLLFGAATSAPEPARAQPVVEQAEPVVNCQVIRKPKTLRIVCKAAGITVLDTTVPLPQLPPVTLPPVTLPPITELIPGQTETVRVPGPTQTVRETERVPGPTTTETIRTPRATVTETVTETTSPSPSGQEGGRDDTIDRDDGPIDLDDGDVTIEEVGLGLLGILALAAFALLGMWGGYAIGYKDADRENADFMDALLDKAKIGRGKHR